jgi:hypothetical protein
LTLWEARKGTNHLTYSLVRELCSFLLERIKNPEALEHFRRGVSLVMNIFCFEVEEISTQNSQESLACKYLSQKERNKAMEA